MQAYDTPGLSAHEFLLVIMRDQTFPLHIRMRAAEAACRAGYGDIGTIRTQHVVIDGGIPAGADQTKAPDYQLGVASDAGKAPGHRPPRRHRGFYLVRA